MMLLEPAEWTSIAAAATSSGLLSGVQTGRSHRLPGGVGGSEGSVTFALSDSGLRFHVHWK